MVGQMIRVPLIRNSSTAIDKRFKQLPALLYTTQELSIDLASVGLVAFLDLARCTADPLLSGEEPPRRPFVKGFPSFGSAPPLRSTGKPLARKCRSGGRSLVDDRPKTPSRGQNLSPIGLPDEASTRSRRFSRPTNPQTCLVAATPAGGRRAAFEIPSRCRGRQ